MAEQGEEALSPALQLKYACLKNIGTLQQAQGCLEDALDAYLEAVQVGWCAIDIKVFQPSDTLH